MIEQKAPRWGAFCYVELIFYKRLHALVARIKSLLRWGLVLFCVPKENQKSTRYFRGAGGTNQGLLALDNPGGVVETEKS